MGTWVHSGNKRLYFAALIFLFLFLVTLRGVHLTADPPSRLSWSGGLFGDEPAYAHNARNKAVFGAWVLDEWNPFLYNPILTFCDYLSFKVFGTGFFALRMVAFFWGILSLFFVFEAFRRSFEKLWVACLALLLLEMNYFFVMYTRLSLSDTMLTNWMILTLFLWALGRGSPAARFLSGLSAVGVFSCKPTAIYFAFVIGIAYLFAFVQGKREEKDLRSTSRYLFPYAAGLGIGLVTWFIVYYLPFHAQIARYSVEWSKLSMPRGVGDFMDRVLGGHAPIVFKHFAWFPMILLTGWLYLPISFYRAVRKWRDVNPLEFLVMAWFVIGYFALSGFRYRPPRYFVSLVPPLVFLAVCGLLTLISVGAGKRRLGLGKGFWILYAGWVVLTGMLSRKYLHFSSGDIVMGGAALLGGGIGAWIVGKIQEGRWIPRRFLAHGIAIAIVVMVIGHNLWLYAAWFRKPLYKEVNISREIGTLVPGGVIAGLWSPMVCMENNNQALCIAPGWFNDKDPYGKYRFTHLFLWRGNRDAELSMVRRVLGRKFLKTRLIPVARFNIKDAWAYLFKVKEK